MLQVALFFCIGFLAGFMSGMFGIGGGSVRIPLLNLVGVPLLSAFGINLLVVPFSSAVGVAAQRRNINREVVPYVMAGGMLGSIVGALLVGLVSTLSLAVIFVAVSIITVAGIYLYRIAPDIYLKINPSPKLLIAGSFLLNLITGMRGGSGGSLFPAFLRAVKLDIREAVATSLFITVFTAIGAFIIYWQRGDILWLPALCVLMGSMAGAKVGSSVSLKTEPTWLEAGLSALVIALALMVVYRALQ
ncbi:MAG: sulfite exporter TauE/SafE family protein [Methermicoccaceae archaeon]